MNIEIPEGYEARIEGNKVVLEPKENEDEKIRTRLIALVEAFGQGSYKNEMLAYLEKQKDEAQKQFNLGVQAGREEAMYEIEKEQKPAEWSEEDEKKRVELKTFIAQCNGFNKENRKKAFDMIDAFRPWKPSAQEKWALHTAIHILTKERHLPKAATQLQNILEAFDGKSRKDWKPSEEQMEALMLAIEGKWEAILPTGYMSRRLEDLYEWLVNTFKVECPLKH